MNGLRLALLDLSAKPTSKRPEPLSGADAAEDFFRSLPRADPIVSQRLLCDVLAPIGGGSDPDIGQLRALVVLDRRAQALLDRLMTDYLALGAQSSDRGPQLRQAALELSRSFASGYDFFLRYMRDKNPGVAWLRRLSAILVQLFKHREVELLLSLFRYEPWPRGHWRDLNAAFHFALINGLADQHVVRERRDGKVTRTLTPEQAFIRVLLLRLVDSSAFAPSELNAVRHWIAGWSMLMTVQRANDAALQRADGFFLDLSSAEGLQRALAATSGNGEILYLDTMPVVVAIEKELATTCPTSAGSARSHTRRLILLSKLKRTFVPRPERTRRRHERTEATLASVQVVAGGLPSICRLLRDESRRLSALQGPPSSYAEGTTMTITDNPSYTHPAQPSALRASIWRVLDRSESGYQLQGRAANAQHLAPGSLVAFRDHDAGRWALAFIRRLKRSVGNNVRVGIERIGGKPQRVVLSHHSAAAGNEKCIGLFLLENDSSSRTAIRTLLLPPPNYAPGRELTMLSRTNETKIRLGAPIEHQGEFVWTSLEILNTRTRLH